MRDASVGFQCPTCVSEGAKTTRSGRTAYGGLRPTNASITSIGLILTNVLVWVSILATGGNSSRLVDLLALRPNGACIFPGRNGVVFEQSQASCAVDQGTWLPGVVDGAYWQLITNAFVHVDLTHIGFNMLMLYFFGPQLEALLGRTRFLALYVLSALTASALVYWLSGEYTATLGASGAVFGLLGALLVVAFKVGGNVQSLVMLLALNAVFTLVIPNISWQGHLGGFLGGAAVAAVLVYAPKPPKRTRFQIAGLTGVAIIAILAAVVRSLTL
ncbi:rhomboid family intramembrane serine protease [Nocardioides salsibiostraticola]